MNPISQIYGLALLFCVSILLRSLFNYLTAKNTMKKPTFYLLFISISCGIYHLLSNYKLITESEAAPSLIIFLFGVSYVFYSMSRTARDADYTLADSIKTALAEVSIVVVSKFSSKNDTVSIITYEQLDSFEFEKKNWIDGIAIIKHRTPNTDLFFTTIFPPGIEMNLQEHPNADEWCNVVQGVMIDKKTGKKYKAGEHAFWKAGEEHAPASGPNEKLILHVHFKKI